MDAEIRERALELMQPGRYGAKPNPKKPQAVAHRRTTGNRSGCVAFKAVQQSRVDDARAYSDCGGSRMDASSRFGTGFLVVGLMFVVRTRGVRVLILVRLGFCKAFGRTSIGSPVLALISREITTDFLLFYT